MDGLRLGDIADKLPKSLFATSWLDCLHNVNFARVIWTK